MNNKRNIYFYIIVFSLLSGLVSETKALTTDELSDICKKMESGIVDISIEYEWRTIPPWTFEEVDKKVGPGTPVGIYKDGYSKCRLTAATLPSLHDSNDPNFPLIDGVLFEESKTLINREGTTHDSLLKMSCIGRISKRLDIQTVPKSVCTGVVSYVERPSFPANFSMLLTPIGFSVHRLNFSNISAHKPLSFVLRELGRLDNTIRQINGFQTVRVDILQQSTRHLCMRVYFSVDHGYTPIRYEYMSGLEPKVSLTIDVHSLQKVAPGLWFPSEGVVIDPEDDHLEAYIATDKITVNQGLTDKHFDIDFPLGTKVWNGITGVKYVVEEPKTD